jgi:peptidoglycan L-alanyl-D-glutamate endopeptidase CwlK
LIRDIGELDKETQIKVRRWLAACEAAGLDVLITSTYRSFAEQRKLFLQSPKVTNADQGQSEHNWRRALDFVPMQNGKPVWSPKSPLWSQIAALAKIEGLEWGGDWKRFRDMPHLQNTKGRPSWRELLKQHPQGLPE